MAISKGKPPHLTGGSRKGIPNKSTKELKEAIRQALEIAGGVHYLARQAEENPAAFMTLVGKILPKEITGEGGGPLKMVLDAIELVPLRGKAAD